MNGFNKLTFLREFVFDGSSAGFVAYKFFQQSCLMLLQKLAEYGIEDAVFIYGVEFIRFFYCTSQVLYCTPGIYFGVAAFLSIDRSLEVKVKTCFLTIQSASCGVPQACTLGPLLFFISITDIGAFFSGKFCLFVEDLNILQTSSLSC